MDFNAKRLALLAGIGNFEDRHDIVQEQAQQLNESAETRQANSDEEEVRKAVRRTIQKMISEGVIGEGEGYGITGGAMHVFEEDVDESSCSVHEEEDRMEDDGLEEEMVMGADSADLDGPPPSDYMPEEEQEEGMIYELEEELEEITLYEDEGKLHTTIDGVDYELVKKQ